jgi:hypothetical protein
VSGSPSPVAYTDDVNPPEPEVDPMAELTTKKRDKIPDSTFGLPDERKYPMPDKSHARNAKARASQQAEKGNLTAAEERTVDRKADRILKK